MAAQAVSLVTGGGSGIGRSAAVMFASKGCKVCVADVDEVGGAETCKLIAGTRCLCQVGF
jgi:NAD(P)-dependent dehydrogenase (short-subunit alcohol dehydrogenase family)